MSLPLVSALMTTYNRGSKIGATIESVLAQTYSNLELVVVNNGSTDNSSEVLEQWARRDARIRVFHQENLQMAGGRNATLRHARGEYLAIIDSDDFWYPEKVALQVEAFSRSQAIGLVCTDFDNVASGKTLQKRALKGSYLNWQRYPRNADLFENIGSVGGCEFAWGSIFSGFLFGNLALPSSVMISRKAVEWAGEFRYDYKALGEDFEYALRISRHYEIGFIDGPLVRYTVGSADQLSGGLKQQVGIARAYLDIYDEYVSKYRDEIRTSDRDLKRHRARTLAWLGSALLQVGEKSIARARLIESLKLDPTRKQVYKQLAKTFL